LEEAAHASIESKKIGEDKALVSDKNEFILEEDNNLEHEFDNRGFFKYIVDYLFIEHPLLSLFKLSLIEPYYVRLVFLLFSILIEFALNALLYTENWINAKALQPDSIRNGFFYPLVYECPKIATSILLCAVIEAICRVILWVPSKTKIQFHEAIAENSNDQAKVTQLYHAYLKSNLIRYIIFLTFVILVSVLFTYYIIAFCTVYSLTATGWVYSALISLFFDWFFICLLIPIFMSTIRSIMIKNPKLKGCNKISYYACMVIKLFFS